MTKDEVVKLMNQLADALKSWVDQNTNYEVYFNKETKPVRNLTATLSGPLPQAQVEQCLDYIECDHPLRFRQLRKLYRRLIRGAKKIDRLTQKSTKSAIENSQKSFGSLRYCAYRLVNAFRDTAEELSTKPPNLMALTIIPKHFDVSERTLRRRVKKKKLKKYPDEDGTVFLDTVEVARRYAPLKR